MAYPVQQQAKYWGVATAAFLIVLWYLGDVILPFVLGGAVAYFLDPVADRLEAWGLSRIMATVTITLVGILLFVIAILLVIPTLVEQTGQLINTAPDLFTRLQAWLTTKFPQLMDADSMIRHQLVAIGETIQSKGGDLINSVVSSAMSLVNVMVLIVVVPVVTFYLLLDWDNMVAKIDDLLPRDHAPVVRDLAGQIDNTLASFIRGQGTVCLVLGSYYAISLMLVGLNFGLVVGFIAGLITFIPYIGALVGGTLAIGLALFQFWGEWGWIAAVGGIFVLGQFLEGNVLTPKLVGKSVGLQPVWLLFALAVFGSSFGFVGMLVAVPVAAMLGVVARFGIAEYKKGRLYKGFAEED
ncbi:MAG: putative PurR-regulated permease PerM [Paracoccaceae bacterium]|jgi:predicted PurR-regulated permease PerM